MTVKVSEIFKERPNQFGLRGDPYLWDNLENHFSNMSGSYSEEAFIYEINKRFEDLTGSSIDSKEFIKINEYSHGGMSSGMIDPQFWTDKAIPLLIERLKRLNIDNA